MKKTITFAGFDPEEFDAMCLALDMSADKLEAGLLADGDDKPRSVTVYDDGGAGWDYSWFVCGHEYGPTFLVRADSEYSAYNIWRDESPTISADDVHEAYGAFDKLLEHMVNLGHENNRALRNFCTRWDRVFFEVSTRDANYTGAWDNWELLEGYEYQSNSSGTGIVDVGHYEWLRPLEGSGYTALFSGVLS